jgi:hypothetical protein
MSSVTLHSTQKINMPHFKRCDVSVQTMAAAILAEYEEHKSLIQSPVQIDYVFAFADLDTDGFPRNDALRLGGVKCLGIARIISTKQRALGRGDAEISLDGDWWREASVEQQKALLDHELHHLTVKMSKLGTPVTDDLQRPKLKMRRHDYDFGWFSIIAARHGKASQECVQAKQILDGAGSFLFPDSVMQQLTRNAA